MPAYDPYEGIGTEVKSSIQTAISDPYAGIGTVDKDPYEGIGTLDTSSPRVETPDTVSSGADVSSFPSARGAPSSLTLDGSQHPGDLAFQEKLKADAMAKVQKEGGLKAAGREAAFGVVPTLSGIGTGALVGAGLGTLGAGPVGTVVGGLVGGIGAAVGADWAQGKALSAIAPDQAAQWQAEREAAAQVHPYASMAGSLAPQLIAMKPSLKNVATAAKGAKMLISGGLTKEVAATPVGKQLVDQMFNVGIGAGVQGAQEAYAQYQAGDFNAARMAAQVIAGAIVNEPNKFGVKMGLHPSGGEEVRNAPKPELPMAETPDTSKVRQFTPESRAIYEDDVLRFNEARAKEGKAPVKMADVWSNDIEAAGAVADRVGIRMVMVDGMDENGAALSSDPSVVFVSTKSEQPVLTVAAHEIKHNMDAAHPDLAEKLDSVLAEHIAERGAVQGETHADAFAEALSNPQFWTRLARQDMTLFERLYKIVQVVIETVSKAIPEAYRVRLKSKDSFFKVQEAAMEAYRGMAKRADSEYFSASPEQRAAYERSSTFNRGVADRSMAEANAIKSAKRAQPFEEATGENGAQEPAQETPNAMPKPPDAEPPTAAVVEEVKPPPVEPPGAVAAEVSPQGPAPRADATPDGNVAAPIPPPAPVPTKIQARPDTGKATKAEAGVSSKRGVDTASRDLFERQSLFEGESLPEQQAKVKTAEETSAKPLAWTRFERSQQSTDGRFGFSGDSHTGFTLRDGKELVGKYRTENEAKAAAQSRLTAPKPEAPKAAPQSLTPADAVSQGRAIKVPTGTLKVRATFADGNKATVFVRDLDTLKGVGKITRLEPLQGGDKPVKGEIIVKPDSGNGGVKYSERKVTPEDDRKYLSAVERGDTAEAQRMVDDAAKQAGYNVGPVYHGTDPWNNFNEFKTPAYFGEIGTAYRAGQNVKRVFLKIERPASGVSGFENQKYIVKESQRKGFQKKYDGWKLDQGNWVALDPSQIKSADPITTDDQGRVIPLSERFSDASADIRYSTKRYTLENATPEAEQAKAKLDAERETEQAKFKQRHSFQQLRDWFGPQFVSWEAPIETRLKGKGDLADTVMRAFRAVRGASGRSNERVEGAVKSALLDNGIKSKADVHFLNDVREAQRTIEADEVHRRTVDKAYPMRNDPLWTPADEAAYQKELTFKSPLSVKQAQDFLAGARRDSRWASIEKANAAIQKEYADNLAALNKAGIISDNLYKYITDNHKAYQPRVFLDKIDPVRVMDNGRGGKVEVHDSGIRALEQGSDKAMISDTVYLLANNIYHTESIIAKNKATMALRDLIRAKPDAIDAKVLDRDEAVPAGYEPVKFRENGVTETIAMNRDLAKHWRLSDPALDQLSAKLLRTLSGTSTVKFLATAGNPEFAVANVLRDIGLIWLGGRQFSPFLPAALAQTARNLGRQAMSRQLRRTLKAKYSEYGGSTDNLSTAGHLTDLHNPGAYTTGRRLVNKAMHGMGYIGTLSEEANRLSHMQQTLRNMGVKVGESGWESRVTPEQWDKAVYEASNLLDFRQGGKFVKMLDNVIPFINASTQGSRTVVRAFRDRPFETAAKAAQLVAIGAYIAWWNRKNNANAWESMSENEKNTRINFTMPASYKDKNGNERHAYIGLPIDQAWRPFMVLGEMMAEKQAGKDVNPMRLTKVVNANFSPVDLGTMPPIMAAFLTYTQNHNFWKGEDVWKGRPVEASAERLPSTPEFFKKAGDVTGLSPERLKAAEQTMIPQNPWTSAGSEAIDFFGTPDDEKVRNNNLIDAERVPGLRKLLRFTSGRQFTRADQTKARKLGVTVSGRSPAAILNESAEKERVANTAKQKNDLQFDTMVGRYKAKQVSRADIMRAIYKMKDDKGKPDLAEMKRIRNRLHTRYPELHFPGGME